MREIVKCKCGKVWFKDSVPYVELKIIYGKEFPKEGYVYETSYYCEDCVSI